MYTETAEFLQRKLDEGQIDPDQMMFITTEINALQHLMANSPWQIDLPATQKQMGYLVGIFDLQDGDRHEFLSAMVGFQTMYMGDIPGMEMINSRPRSFGEASFMDERITKWVAECLINYFKDDVNGQELIDAFNYERASVAYSQAVSQRRAIKANNIASGLTATGKSKRQSKKSIAMVGGGL